MTVVYWIDKVILEIANYDLDFNMDWILSSGNLAAYALPGIVCLYIRSHVGKGHRPELAEYLVFSIVYWLIILWLLSLVDRDYKIFDAAGEFSVDWLDLMFSGVLPAILGVILGLKGSYLVDKQASVAQRIKSIFSFREATVQTAWYYLFDSNLTAQIRVELDDGSTITGWYTGAACASQEEPHDLFVSKFFNDKMMRGWWIPRAKVKTIQFVEFENEKQKRQKQ